MKKKKEDERIALAKKRKIDDEKNAAMAKLRRLEAQGKISVNKYSQCPCPKKPMPKANLPKPGG